MDHEGCKMRITKRQLRRIIKEELENILDYKHADEIEPEEEAWAGGDNLVDPIDFQEIATGDAVEPGIEIAPVVSEVFTDTIKKALHRESRKLRIARIINKYS
jgi:hypothetical protein